MYFFFRKTIGIVFLTIIYACHLQAKTGSILSTKWKHKGVKARRHNSKKNQVDTPIQAAAKSVFRIITLNGTPEVEDFSQDPLRSRYEYYYINQPDPLITVIMLTQLKICKQQKTLKKCPIYFDIGFGSGFLFQNNNQIVTNFHVISEVVKELLPGARLPKDILNFFNTHPLKMLILTNDLKVLSTPAQNPIYLFDTPFHNFNTSAYNIDTAYDFAELHLQKDISGYTPLEPTTETDGPAFLVGFNMTKESTDLNSSSLYPQSTISGHLIGWDAARSYVSNLMPMSNMSELSAETALGSIFFAGESMGGQSGGPYLNKTGKVAGINAGEMPEDFGAAQLSRGAKIHRFLEMPISMQEAFGTQ